MARIARHNEARRRAQIAQDEHKDSPAIVIAGYVLVLIASLLIVGAAYGLWLFVARIF